MNTQDVIRYYKEYNEDNRLIRDNSNRIEYLLSYDIIASLITTYFNNKKIKLIDVGCGTGCYTIPLSTFCEKITACDIIEESLNILQDKANHFGIDNIDIIHTNAISLSSIPSNEFDIVLCMGPLYHLDQDTDRNLCLAEMSRIIKKEGVAIFSYLNIRALWANVIKGKLSMTAYLNIDTENVSIPPFYFNTPKNIITELENKGWRIISHYAVDPISCFFQDTFNSLNEEEYNLWLKKVKTKMHTPDYLNLSSHNIIIAVLNETT